MIVAVYHISDPCFATPVLMPLSRLSVAIFFLLSAWVLVRSWDGDLVAFLIRRFIRLWPTYVVCVLAGYAVMHLPVDPAKLFWLARVSPYSGTEMDRPAWSLFYEAWAMPFIPILAWSSRRAVRAAGMAAAIFFVGMIWHPEVLYGEIFLLGACMSGLNWRSRTLESSGLQWLGKLSYSIYLTHWVLLQAVGPIPTSFLAFPIAWGVWRIVEIPSIRFSRRAVTSALSASSVSN